MIRAPWSRAVTGIYICFLVLAGSGCSTPQPVRAAVNTSPAVVAVIKPKYEMLTHGVVLNGEFRPYQVTDVHSKVAGFLRQINVDAGTPVRAGQEIAVIDIPEMDAELAHSAAERSRMEAELGRARAELEKAQANAVLVNASLKRLVEASKTEPGIIAQQEIDEAKARYDAAQAHAAAAKAAIDVESQKLASAQAIVRRSQTMSEYRSIVAPFSGVVVKRFVDKGAMIQAGTSSQAVPLVRIAEIARLRLAVAVPESVVPMVRTGDKVEVRVSSLNRKLPATVSRLTRDVASTTRTMEAEIDISNPDAAITPGMYAEVAFLLQKKERGLTIPITAIANSGGNRMVMVVREDGAVEERTIRTGLEGPSTLEVLSGISPDDRVVVSNRGLLKPGQKVEAREAGAQ